MIAHGACPHVVTHHVIHREGYHLYIHLDGLRQDVPRPLNLQAVGIHGQGEVEDGLCLPPNDAMNRGGVIAYVEHGTSLHIQERGASFFAVASAKK